MEGISKQIKRGMLSPTLVVVLLTRLIIITIVRLLVAELVKFYLVTN